MQLPCELLSFTRWGCHTPHTPRIYAPANEIEGHRFCCEIKNRGHMLRICAITSKVMCQCFLSIVGVSECVGLGLAPRKFFRSTLSDTSEKTLCMTGDVLTNPLDNHWILFAPIFSRLYGWGWGTKRMEGVLQIWCLPFFRRIELLFPSDVLTF